MKKLGVCVILYSLWGIPAVTAQQDTGRGKIVHTLETLAQTYKQAGRISYDICYRYSNESTPGTVLDSVCGHIEMDSTGYWCVLDSTETMVNSRVQVMVFKEDKIIYLSKAPAGNTMQPLEMLTALLKDTPDIQYTENMAGGYQTLRIAMPPGALCKTLEYTIDTHTGLLTGMSYIVPTSQLTETPSGKGLEEAPAGYEAYARVAASFYNYREPVALQKRLDENSFFYRSGQEFLPAAAYKDYKLFIASPNF